MKHLNNLFTIVPVPAVIFFLFSITYASSFQTIRGTEMDARKQFCVLKNHTNCCCFSDEDSSCHCHSYHHPSHLE